MNATDIVGYTYQADIICPGCMVDTLIADSRFDQTMFCETQTQTEFIDTLASRFGYTDENTYDSGDFPKVIFASDVTSDDVCGICHGELI